jgi:hypothetical protein
MTERELENAICELLDTLGIYYHHDRPAPRRSTHDGKQQWQNHFRGPRGFPDLLIVGDRIIFAELKSHSGTLTQEQQIWLDRLRMAGCEVYVWRPIDWLNGTVGELLVGARI